MRGPGKSSFGKFEQVLQVRLPAQKRERFGPQVTGTMAQTDQQAGSRRSGDERTRLANAQDMRWVTARFPHD